MTQTCRKCLESFTLDRFPKNHSYKNGHASICKTCQAKVTAQYREDNYNKVYANKYGVTEQEIHKLFSHMTCHICGTDKHRRRMNIDHCHTTGKVRGLLCDPCNKGIGNFKDSIELLEKAKQYLNDRN